MIKQRYDFVGLSTESKPDNTNERVINGSTFYEVDTSKLFIYYNGTWYEQS